MAAYVITYLEVTDTQAFDAYRRVAGPTFAPYGGRPVVVDGPFEVLEGMIHPKSIVVIEFDTLEQAASGQRELDSRRRSAEGERRSLGARITHWTLTAPASAATLRWCTSPTSSSPWRCSV